VVVVVVEEEVVVVQHSTMVRMLVHMMGHSQTHKGSETFFHDFLLRPEPRILRQLLT